MGEEQTEVLPQDRLVILGEVLELLHLDAAQEEEEGRVAEGGGALETDHVALYPQQHLPHCVRGVEPLVARQADGLFGTAIPGVLVLKYC